MERIEPPVVIFYFGEGNLGSLEVVRNTIGLEV